MGPSGWRWCARGSTYHRGFGSDWVSWEGPRTHPPPPPSPSLAPAPAQAQDPAQAQAPAAALAQAPAQALAIQAVLGLVRELALGIGIGRERERELGRERGRGMVIGSKLAWAFRSCLRARRRPGQAVLAVLGPHAMQSAKTALPNERGPAGGAGCARSLDASCARRGGQRAPAQRARAPY